MSRTSEPRRDIALNGRRYSAGKEVKAMSYRLIAAREKAVFVTAYTRFRFGKLEWVCSHFRSWPR